MMISKRLVLLTLALTVGAAAAWGQTTKKEPHIGYLYPAGAQQGTTTRVLAGGQLLGSVSEAVMSGAGVNASVIRHYKPVRKIDPEQRNEIARQIKAARAQRLTELEQQGVTLSRVQKWQLEKARKAVGSAPVMADGKPVVLPPHPLLENIADKSLRELEHIERELWEFKKRQPNMQIAEMTLLEITVAPDAAPGDRELRLLTASGLTNPLCFQVGLLPEVREQEPNDPGVQSDAPDEPACALPAVVNGQIMPGDVDRFEFKARQGERVVLAVHARRLVPYLADAVPGWFQATLAVYDAWGDEVAYADDYRFDPDPVLCFDVPRDSIYTLEVRDSIYRGREDFVYRIAVGVLPFVTRVYPLGGRMGTGDVAAEIGGWNLTEKRLPLDMAPGGEGIRYTCLRQADAMSNEIAYQADPMPECTEKKANDPPAKAQYVKLPRMIDGRIEKPGDVDVYEFRCEANDEVVAEIYARRLRSPLDSVLRLMDESGQVLAWNDDSEDKSVGWCTHHADSYLRAQIPAAGIYRLSVSDAQAQGGDACGYRLRISAPRPDFVLRVTPASLNIPAGRAAAVTVHAFRRDGFDGAIDLSLRDAPEGFALQGARIPCGQDCVRMTVTAPYERPERPLALHLEGRAQVAGMEVTRAALPAENMMQAFFYHHLALAGDWMTAVLPAKARSIIEVAGEMPVRIPAGGATDVRILTPNRSGKLKDITVTLNEPPPGIAMETTAVEPKAVTLRVRAEASAVPGAAGNLIIEASAAYVDPKNKAKRSRVSLGILPAIPYEIVQP